MYSITFSGFSELSLNDQMRLLQSSWSEILTLSLVFRSLPTSGRLNFAADFSLTEPEAKECGLWEFFNHVSRENGNFKTDNASSRYLHYSL